MKIFYDLDSIDTNISCDALTIGVFDGVHRGHQYLFHSMSGNNTVCAITYTNNPTEVLTPLSYKKSLFSFSHKTLLIEKCHIDYLVLLTFTKKFAEESYQDFMHSLRKKISFKSLYLGVGASIGKNNLGDEKNLSAYAKKEPFNLFYIKKLQHQNKNISSMWIRDLVVDAKFSQAKELLGRNFSTLIEQKDIFKKNDHYIVTLIIDKHLLLPKNGYYHVSITAPTGKILSSTYLKVEGNRITIFLLEDVISSLPFYFIQWEKSITSNQLKTGNYVSL